MCSPLVRNYLINYARPLIYSTALPFYTVIAVDCVLDMLERGETAEVSDLFRLRLLSDRIPFEALTTPCGLRPILSCLIRGMP